MIPGDKILHYNHVFYFCDVRTSFYHDHVPASCCNFAVLRPCIHTDVHGNDIHPEYNYKTNLTIHKTGTYVVASA